MIRLVTALIAFDIADELALIEILDRGALLSCNSEALLNSIKKYTAELLSVMLLKTLSTLPSEAFCKALGIYRSLSRKLEMREESL